jgi:hypothetical protein
VRISRIDDINKGISIGKIVSPIFSKCFLPSNIPNVKFEFIVSEVLDVEPLGWSDG